MFTLRSVEVISTWPLHTSFWFDNLRIASLTPNSSNNSSLYEDIFPLGLSSTGSLSGKVFLINPLLLWPVFVGEYTILHSYVAPSDLIYSTILTPSFPSRINLFRLSVVPGNGCKTEASVDLPVPFSPNIIIISLSSNFVKSITNSFLPKPLYIPIKFFKVILFILIIIHFILIIIINYINDILHLSNRII